MKKCVKCECLYPDYYDNCPACGSTEKKEWKQAPIELKPSDLKLGPDREVEKDEPEIDYDFDEESINF